MHISPSSDLFNPRLMWATALLTGTLLVGAIVIALVQRWRRRGEEPPDVGSELSRYRALYEKGEINEEEYNRVRDLLRSQMRTAFGAGKPSPPPRPEQDPPTEGEKPS